MLVDPNENVITDDSEGLLLFEGGTVCNDGWTNQTANLICRKMGHHAATSWRNGLVVCLFVFLFCLFVSLFLNLFVCLFVVCTLYVCLAFCSFSQN